MFSTDDVHGTLSYLFSKMYVTREGLVGRGGLRTGLWSEASHRRHYPQGLGIGNDDCNKATEFYTCGYALPCQATPSQNNDIEYTTDHMRSISK